MDITGTEQADIYDQTAQGPGEWNTYRGLGGNDTIRMFNGTAAPGAGVDTVEHLQSADTWRVLEVAYWDSPKGIVVDLAAGWADDGWGTRDTLIDVSGVHGSGRDDRMFGNAKDNTFYPNGGHDTVDGRDGTDTVGLPWNAGDPLDLSNFNIVLSTDAKQATITSKTDKNLLYELTSIERLQFWNGSTQTVFDIAAFINPKTMAEQGLTGSNAQRWNAATAVGTAVNVTFSFAEIAPMAGVGAAGFRSFNAVERQVVRDLLNSTSAVTGLTFTEVAEMGAAAGQIRFGVSAQTATKGLAAMPDIAASNAAAGDVWMDMDSMLNLSPGTEGYAALLHELGHALGLRHPRNVDAGDAWAQQLRVADDKTSFTVMSGTASGDGLFRADWGPLDVAALHYLYGSKAVNGGDNTYMVGGADALAERTLLDSGGIDTIDASASRAGVSIDLTAGRLSSVGLSSDGLAPVENLGIGVGSLIENAIGSDFDDVLMGNALGNSLNGKGGNDWMDGGGGVDVAVFSGMRADYSVSSGFGKVFVAAQNGVGGFDTLLNIERLKFSDGGIALDTGATQSAGQAQLLLGAVLGKDLLATKKPLLGTGIDLFDQGYTFQQLSGAIMRLDIWGILANGGQASATPTQIANYLLTTVNKAAPDPSTLAAAVMALNTETGAAQGNFLWHLAESAANQIQVGLVGLAATGLAYIS